MISIIVPCYNVEKYVEKCIDSILSNTYQDFECILIDDCSTDATLEKIEQYQYDPRIRIIKKANNQGQSAARNDGIAAANGEFLFFIDADDWISSDCLQYIYIYILGCSKKLPIDLIITRKCVVVQNDDQEDIYSPRKCEFVEAADNNSVMNNIFKKMIGFSAEDIEQWNKTNLLPERINGYATGILYSKRIIDDNHIQFTPGLSMKEDTFFNLHYLLHCNSIGCIEKDCYFYRIRADRTNSVAQVDADYKKSYKNKIGQLAERTKLRRLANESHAIDILPMYSGTMMFAVIDMAIICNHEPFLGYKAFKGFARDPEVIEAISLLYLQLSNLKFNIPLLLFKTRCCWLLYLIIKALSWLKLDSKLKKL